MKHRPLLRHAFAVACLAASRASAADVDHADYAGLLKRHVDARGMVDYAAIKRQPADLDRYLSVLASVKLDALDPQQRLATLINAYNAFTLKLISERYPIATIKDIPEPERWKAVRWNLGGTTTSLDAIEHEMIRGKYAEPRIHFALVCAGRGCPPLRAEPYTGARLEAQLDHQMKRTHAADTQWSTYDAAANKLTVTAIYKWFEGDFTQSAANVPAFVARYRPDVRRAIDAGRVPTVEHAPYDWGLNDQTK